ncbi:MAG: hypothetical protein CMC70_00835 [Flavobacteriaceae bacterium]|nr:hypothetical protein [Flavobacteriaceae bacterium]
MKNNNKYKILVLVDLTDNSVNVLKSATRMAQIIGGEIEIFHVRKPTKVVRKESHLSAVRVIKDHFVLVENELKSMGNQVSENNKVIKEQFFAFGNLKNEIENQIKKINPDILVLGKKMSKTPAFMGDNLLPFILKKFQGVVMVADNTNVLGAESKINLGLYNTNTLQSKLGYIDALVSNSEASIRAYEVAGALKTTNPTSGQYDASIVSYVFEQNDTTLQTMSNYMDKNKINLLFVNRNSKTSDKKGGLSISELNNLAHSIKVPLLFANE